MNELKGHIYVWQKLLKILYYLSKVLIQFVPEKSVSLIVSHFLIATIQESKFSCFLDCLVLCLYLILITWVIFSIMF